MYRTTHTGVRIEPVPVLPPQAHTQAGAVVDWVAMLTTTDLIACAQFAVADRTASVQHRHRILGAYTHPGVLEDLKRWRDACPVQRRIAEAVAADPLLAANRRHLERAANAFKNALVDAFTAIAARPSAYAPPAGTDLEDGYTRVRAFHAAYRNADEGQRAALRRLLPGTSPEHVEDLAAAVIASGLS